MPKSRVAVAVIAVISADMMNNGFIGVVKENGNYYLGYRGIGFRYIEFI